MLNIKINQQEFLYNNRSRIASSLILFFNLFLLGCMTGLSYSPDLNRLSATFLYLVSHAFFFIVLSEIKKKQALAAFLFYFGYYFSGLYWIGYSFVTAAGDLDSLSWINYLILKSSFMLVPLLFTINMFVGHLFINKKLNLSMKKMIYGLVFMLIEWCRGEFYLGGFPFWLGYEFLPLEVLQLVPYLGIYGLSFLMTTSVVVFSIFLDNPKEKIRFFTVLIFIAMFTFLYLFGSHRLKNYQISYTDTYVRLVQPSVSRKNKSKKTYYAQSIKKLLELSNLKSNRSFDFIIWPETSVGDYLDDNPKNLRKFLKNLDDPQVNLMFGKVRYEIQNDFNEEKKLNSLLLVNQSKEDQIIAIYDKRKLVPLTEHIPLKISFIKKMVEKRWSHFTPGEKDAHLEVNNQPAALPLICYESIFPIQSAKNKEWIVNITNDIWFEKSWGSKNHLRIAQIRAIETGLPVVRVANNGISAIIDPVGNIVSFLKTDEQGVIDTYLPKKINIQEWMILLRKYFDKAYMIILLIGMGYLSFLKKVNH